MGHFFLCTLFQEDSLTVENLQGLTSSLLQVFLIIVVEFKFGHHSKKRIKLQHYQAKPLQLKNTSFVLLLKKVPLQLPAGFQIVTSSMLREPPVPRKAISHRAGLFVPTPWMTFAKSNLLIRLCMTMR